jgi:hypothetical protein
MPYGAARDEDAGARQRIVERLETLKRAYAYDGFVVVDGSAQQILASGCTTARPKRLFGTRSRQRSRPPKWRRQISIGASRATSTWTWLRR